MTAPWAAGEEPRVYPIERSGDLVHIRQAIRTLSQECRLSLVDQTKMITAASELARNTLTYGGGGTVKAGTVSKGGKRGVAAIFEDSGPGIPDIEQAMTDGWTSGGGLGLGLSGARRLVDDFDLNTAPGEGTVVTIIKWVR
ncbi:anti-sigma regulatory factor [Streptomyces sp. NPDC007172]|uniref:anti-sigma regulatory factor n=1 Tax=unclassified Streptomyces TaxID=2593676 RepID=UPI00368011C9